MGKDGRPLVGGGAGRGAGHRRGNGLVLLHRLPAQGRPAEDGAAGPEQGRVPDPQPGRGHRVPHGLQVGHAGPGLLLQGGRDPEVRPVGGGAPQLLHPDGAAQGHGHVLPRALGGAGVRAARGARHVLQRLALVRRRRVQHPALAHRHRRPAGAQALRHQRRVRPARRVRRHPGALLALVQRQRHQDQRLGALPPGLERHRADHVLPGALPGQPVQAAAGAAALHRAQLPRVRGLRRHVHPQVHGAPLLQQAQQGALQGHVPPPDLVHLGPAQDRDRPGEAPALRRGHPPAPLQLQPPGAGRPLHQPLRRVRVRPRQVPQRLGHVREAEGRRLPGHALDAPLRQLRLGQLRRGRAEGPVRAGAHGRAARAGALVERHRRHPGLHQPGRARLVRLQPALPALPLRRGLLQVRRGRDQLPALAVQHAPAPVRPQHLHAPLLGDGHPLQRARRAARGLPVAEHLLLLPADRPRLAVGLRAGAQVAHPRRADHQHPGLPVHHARHDRRQRLPQPDRRRAAAARPRAVHPLAGAVGVHAGHAVQRAAVGVRRGGGADRAALHRAARDAGGAARAGAGLRGAGHRRPHHPAALVDRHGRRDRLQDRLAVPDRRRPDGGAGAGAREAGAGHLPPGGTLAQLQGRDFRQQGALASDRLPRGPGRDRLLCLDVVVGVRSFAEGV
ncbi:hypothetical protein ANANG_G00258570, partial [Anguilla anguilla]